jgi:predicted Fe-Mo cluster-binding NifX family protein
MKIAFATNDGTSVEGHFGHCSGFLVLTVEDGAVTDRAYRPRPSGGGDAPGHHGSGPCFCRGAGTAPGAADPRDLISDCQAVLCLGMGPRAAESLQRMGVRPVILPGPARPEEAALAFARGELSESTPPGGAGCCHGTT